MILKTTFSILLASAIAVMTAVVIALLGNGLHEMSAWSALLIGMVGGVVAYKNISEKKEIAVPVTFWSGFVITFFILVSLRAFLWLVYNDGDVIKVLSPNNLGDLSLHISFIHYLANVTHWLPKNPLLINEPFHYPFGPDLLNTLLFLVGVPWEQGLLWVGLIGAALTGIALWRWGGAFGMAAFLFNGGLAGVVLLHGYDSEMQGQWKNLFLSMFVTQRGFLYALPAGLLLMSHWRGAFFHAQQETKNESLPLWIQIILLGALPLFSPHSFLFLAAMIVSLGFFNLEARKQLIKLALVAWPLAIISTLIISPGGTGKSFMAWYPGWMQEGNALWFWIWNFGISLPLIGLLFIKLFFSKDQESKQARPFVWPALIIFIICLFFRLAPWPWDNMKLMIWSWLIMAPFLWNLLIKPCSAWLRILLCFLLFASGFLTLLHGLDKRHGYEIAKETEIDAAAALLKNMPAEAVIATAPDYNHPVLMLGHPVVAGYEGHLWSHGLSYKDRLAKLRFIMMGEDGWQATAKALGIHSIYWSWREENAFPHSKLPFAHQQKLPIIVPVHVNE